MNSTAVTRATLTILGSLSMASGIGALIISLIHTEALASNLIPPNVVTKFSSQISTFIFLGVACIFFSALLFYLKEKLYDLEVNRRKEE